MSLGLSLIVFSLVVDKIYS